MLALEHRERTGEGGLVEAAMVDAALNVAAEQAIEFSAYGALLGRDGNRGPTAAPQNLYKVAGPDEHGRDDGWVAIAVATDEQWVSLCRVLGRSDWAADPASPSLAGRSKRARPHRRDLGSVVSRPVGRRDRRAPLGSRRARSAR